MVAVSINNTRINRDKAIFASFVSVGVGETMPIFADTSILMT